MATLVISLGGSLIVPEEIDTAFLKRFKKLSQQLAKRHKLVIVTGGGSTARNYIAPIRKSKLDELYTSLVGIESTKLNASLVAAFLKQFHLLPDSLQQVKKELEKNRVVVCGALGFTPKMTSDGDAAQIAEYINADLLVNLTNVNGLYTKDPKKPGATLIKTITFKNFKKIADKTDYKAGQHFVLDQVAAAIITRAKIKTLILNGKDLKNLEKALEDKPFLGTTING